MDLNKKRKSGSSVLAGGKLKKVSLSAFGLHESDDESTDTQRKTAEGMNTSSVNDVGEDTVVTDVDKAIILKTALWIVNNPTQEGTLREKAKVTPSMSFLRQRDSAAGKMYLNEVRRLKAEREVQSVCAEFACPNNQQQSSLNGYYGPTSTINNTSLQSSMSTVNTGADKSITKSNMILAPSVSDLPCNTTAVVSKPKRNKWGPPVDNTNTKPLVVDSNASNSMDSKPSLPLSTAAVDKLSTTHHNSTNILPTNNSANAFPQNTNGTVNNNARTRVLLAATRKREQEEAEIARLAATFDVESDSADHPSLSPADAARVENEKKRQDALLQEQKELQLLESRIREAAQQNVMRTSGVSNFSAGTVNGDGDSSITDTALQRNKRRQELLSAISENAIAMEKVNSSDGKDNSSKSFPIGSNMETLSATVLSHPIQDKQAELYLERLNHYKELAELDDDDFHDTVADAEANGGVIDGGTREHRKRAKEMLTTAAQNIEVTLKGQGKHHMSHYLPPELLDKFLKKASAVAAGETYKEQEAYEQNKITESNIGYQLLNKGSWTEGSGLGANQTGITVPVSSGTGGGGAPDGAGVGVKATHEVEATDDQFDQYRKRMMLSYRFRPNPMNNPRRNYY